MAKLPDFEGLAIFAKVVEIRSFVGGGGRAEAFQGDRFQSGQQNRSAPRRSPHQPGFKDACRMLLSR
jgi:hypothetical protein